MDSILSAVAGAAREVASVIIGISEHLLPAKPVTVLNERAVRGDDKAAMRHVEREISGHHLEYSNCMADIFEFYNKYGKEDGPVLFMEGLKKKPIDGEIGRIDRCRDVTKDWWRVVVYWDQTYGVFAADKERREVFRRRHDRFVPIVRPLEGTPANEEDAYLFDFKIPKD
jgi:hypothetical protein